MKKRKKELILTIIFIVSFILLSLLIVKDKIITLDNNIHNYILSIRSTTLTNIFKFITSFGGSTFLLILTTILFILVKNKKISINIILNLFIIFLLNQITKNIFLRERPLGINLINETGYSYPSGHAMVSLAYYGYLIYLINKTKIHKILKISSTILLSLLILLIGLSRIYLGVHYFTDIIGGFLLSTTYLLIIKNIKLEKK